MIGENSYHRKLKSNTRWTWWPYSKIVKPVKTFKTRQYGSSASQFGLKPEMSTQTGNSTPDKNFWTSKGPKTFKNQSDFGLYENVSYVEKPLLFRQNYDQQNTNFPMLKSLSLPDKTE